METAFGLHGRFFTECMDAMMNLLAFLDNDMMAQIFFIVGVLVLVTTLLINIIRRRGNRGAARAVEEQRVTASERLEQMGQVKGMRGDLRNLMIEIEELSRHLSAQLDAKSIRIEKLIIEAEEKIARLETLENKVINNSSASSASLTPVIQPDITPAMPVSPSVPEPASVVEETPKQPVAEKVAAAAPLQPTAPAKAAQGDPTKQRIYAMADAGQSAVDIAKELNEHVGKIELILNLRS